MLAKVSGVKLPVPRVTIMPRSRVAGIIQDHVLGKSRYTINFVDESIYFGILYKEMCV